MESSSNFYEFQRQQLGSYSSSAASQSTHGLAAAAIHQWTPTLPLNSDEYNHYMNEILPISAQLGDIRCDDKYSLLQLQQHHKPVDLNQNHWLLTNEVAASSSSSCSNFSYAFDGIYTASSTSCSTTTNLASDFPSYFNHGNNKDKAISSGVKRVSTSSQNGAAVKKKRAASQSSCSLPKGGKEKMGDRIAALHRLVAPFGKTDAASVLTEAIGYIHFLHHQIQTLSMPCTQSDRPRCFQGVLSKQKGEEKQGGLTSRGLSLVPISVASYISSSIGGLD